MILNFGKITLIFHFSCPFIDFFPSVDIFLFEIYFLFTNFYSLQSVCVILVVAHY